MEAAFIIFWYTCIIWHVVIAFHASVDDPFNHISPLTPNLPPLLVSSASHMPRSLGSFCAAGWQSLIPFPTDYRGGTFWDQIGWNLAENLDVLNKGVKERIGLLAYRATGRTAAFFPKECG
jgi:hypothetical protein